MSKQKYTDTPQFDQRAIELINGDIDGELDSTEQLELDMLLADSKHLRDLHTDLKDVTAILDSAPEHEPPGYLQNAIERQVRLPVQNQAAAKNRTFTHWIPSHWLRTGFALSVATVIGIGLYQAGSIPMSPEDSKRMVGTVVKGQDQNHAVTLGSIDFINDELNGVVSLKRLDDVITMQVQLESDTASELVINFGERGFKLESIDQDQDVPDTVTVTSDAVSISGSGQREYSLSFRHTSPSAPAAPITFEFFAHDTLVHEAEISVSKK